MFCIFILCINNESYCFNREEEDGDKDRRKDRRERRERAGKTSKRDQADDGGEWETVRKGAATSDKPKMFAKVCL